MRYFPVFLDLNGRRCLVVGATDEARRKAAALGGAGAAVRSVPSLNAGTAMRLDRLTLAVVATGDRGQDEVAARALCSLSVPVNVVDRPDLCSFIWPAIVDRDPVTIAVSTAGTSPMLATLIRRRIEQAVPAAFGTLARLAGAMRGLVRARLPSAAARRTFWRGVLGGRVAELVFVGRVGEAVAELCHALPSSPRRSKTTALPPA